MVLSHNQMAYSAIAVTMIFGSLFVGMSGFVQTSEGLGFFEPAGEENLFEDEELISQAIDTDGDGLPDKMEEVQYGTDPLREDTDNDGLNDGWEVANGLNPLDSGDADEDNAPPATGDESSSEGNESESWPNPEDGPNGDPDRDGLTNQQEQAFGTEPKLADTDGDGLNDRWEVEYMHYNQTAQDGEVIDLFNPLSGNWNCGLLTEAKRSAIKQTLDNDDQRPSWDEMANIAGQYSCDAILDSDGDGLFNFEEEQYGTDPLSTDSDGDLLSDSIEIAYGTVSVDDFYNQIYGVSVDKKAPFSDASGGMISWYLEDMDGDGKFNGPSDWDTDGDGMPDGFEFYFSDSADHPYAGAAISTTQLLDPANGSDAYHDWDEDDLNNAEEYRVAFTFGPKSFTNPWLADTDADDMPDGWEFENGLNATDGENWDEDPDHDGWDADGDGSSFFDELEGPSARVYAIDVSLDQWVEVNQTVARAQVTLAGGNPVVYPIRAMATGYVYSIHVQLGDTIDSRLTPWLTVVEPSEMFTNLQEYNARDRDGDGLSDSRSTDPLNPDTDGDGLIDGIEVMGWEIQVVSHGVHQVRVISDPGDWDTDDDGLTDFKEFSSVCDLGSNASNSDTDNDGLGDYHEASIGHEWEGENYSTSPCMDDTDNDGLVDGEELEIGDDGYLTHANNSDTDGDELIDGNEALYIPRPWQQGTDPTNNDSDGDGMLDGWEMQVESLEDNSKSHSLWVVSEKWRTPNCDEAQCELDPGGYMWNNWLKGFVEVKKYEMEAMNLTDFQIPTNIQCNCKGRWALNPAEGTLDDALYDIDNDTLTNSAEAPDRWDTNPVDDDTDGDMLPDGWEVFYSLEAIQSGLVDNATLEATGSRGVMDPALIDSDFNGIDDGSEDPDHDGLNRTSLLNKYCKNHDDPSSSDCNINPNTPDGAIFYENLENFTNFEEFENGTNPINNDTDGDEWDDGPEVFYQDHDNDGMATGWEFYFEFDPMDSVDRNIDSDGDGHVNYCEYKWDTNPRDPVSYPGQGQSCDWYNE